MIENVEKLFRRYGSDGHDSSDLHINIYVQNPEKLYTTKDIEKNMQRSTDHLLRLQETISILQSYQIALVERYNEIITAPIQKKCVLKREKRSYENKVFYYILMFDVDLNTKHEELTNSKIYPGSDRKQAFTDFEQMQEENKNWIFEKDIAKKQWEK